MKKTSRLISVCLLFLATAYFWPQPTAALEISVASRQIANYSHWPTVFSDLKLSHADSFQLQSLNRFMVNENKSGFRLKFAAELQSDYSTMGGNTQASWQTSRQQSSYKAVKTNANWLDKNRVKILSEIERFEIGFSAGKFDFQLGRQPVSFGTSHFVSVMDILAPAQPGYLDSSYKPGIDALRIRTISGETGELELVLAAGQKSRDNAALARWRDTFSGFDVEMLAGQFRQRKFIGAGWEGEKRKINFWGEMAVFERQNNFDRHFGGISGKFSTSWIFGLEKNTGHDWRHGIAYFHQDFGVRESEDIAAVYATLPYLQGWTYLAARSYVIINSNREINPLTRLNINTMINLVDKSTLWQPVLSLSLTDESDVAIFAWLKTGASPVSNAGQAELRSEFGAFPIGVGLIYRHYF